MNLAGDKGLLILVITDYVQVCVILLILCVLPVKLLFKLPVTGVDGGYFTNLN